MTMIVSSVINFSVPQSLFNERVEEMKTLLSDYADVAYSEEHVRAAMILIMSLALERFVYDNDNFDPVEVHRRAHEAAIREQRNADFKKRLESLKRL